MSDVGLLGRSEKDVAARAEIFSTVLRSARQAAFVLDVKKLPEGGNNRTYRLQTTDGFYLAKEYFTHAGDCRDRMGTEFGFSRYAHSVACGMVPAPVASSAAEGIAIYEFVEGRPFCPGEIGELQVDRAARFFVALNSQRTRSDALALPLASEAAFSIDGHLTLIDQRLERLAEIDEAGEHDRAARTLVHDLHELWQRVAPIAREQARSMGVAPEVEIGPDQRCLSPSDFGFHNALQVADGNIVFLDFEYAGWDDPSRMAADFFAQIAVPVPPLYLDRFLATCLAPFPSGADLSVRARVLRPVYQVKWCCIALAVFLPTSMARRLFADSSAEIGRVKQAQLAKAQTILNFLKANLDGLY